MTSMQSVSLGEMVAQSRDVISNPSVSTFERYERRGSIGNAAVYVGVAAVISGLLGLVAGMLPWVPGNGLNGLLGGILNALVQFFVFTGVVFLLGKNMAGGSGSWDEVSYTFSLFSAPLIVASAVIGFIVAVLGAIPLLGGLIALAGLLVGLLFLALQVYFAYLAVQSSMNIHDTNRAAVVLVLSFLATMLIMFLVGVIL